MLKKSIKIFTIIYLILIFIFPTYSYGNINDIDIYAPSAILIDADSGKILYNKNANLKMYPASTTKIMTAILTLEKCRLTETVKASHNAIASIPYSYTTAYIEENEELTIEELLNLLLIPSANDAAVILAEHIAGSIKNFAKLMNEKAQELGCKNTHFINPNGIHNTDHYSTAYDLALIGRYASSFDVYNSIIQKTYYKLSPSDYHPEDDRIFYTTNDLIKKNSTKTYYQYCIGGKTGYTDAAKNCIVANAKKDNINLISVVLHDSKTESGLNQRAMDCKTLFEYGFNNFTPTKIFEKNSIITTIKIKNGFNNYSNIDLVCSKNLTALIPNNIDINSFKPEIKLSNNISAPIFEKTNLGMISYTINNNDYSCDLLASKTIYKNNSTKTIIEIILIIIFLYFIGNFLSAKNSKAYKKHKRRKRKNDYNRSSQYINNSYILKNKK